MVEGTMRKATFKTMSSHKSWEWPTPEVFYRELDKEFHFNFDPCPLGGNVDGSARLLNSWQGKRVFCNPPYGPEIRKFLECWKDADVSVFLIPARTDTRWFHDIVIPHAAEIRFIKGRLRFGDGKYPAPFPSMLVIFRGEGNLNHRMSDTELAVLGEQDQCKELALEGKCPR